MKLALCTLIVATVHLCTSERQFNGYTVFRLEPETNEKVKLLNEIANDLDGDIKYAEKVDFWKRPRQVNGTVDVMLAPDVKDEILALFNKNQLDSRQIVADVQKLVNSTRRPGDMESDLKYRSKSWAGQEMNFFTDYHRIDEIHDFMRELAKNYPSRVSVSSIGKSTEGRDMLTFFIGHKTRANKDIIWIDSGIHAREWISPATGLYIATFLITKADSDPVAKELLDTFDFVMLPVSNPDGYEHTHLNDRMWRKTRSRQTGGWGYFCRGTDPNRNWDFHWAEAGASNHPCSDIYAGPSAFSEPETRAMSNYILSVKERMAMYLSLHSYSQLFLTPWGWTKDLPKEYPDMERVAKSAAAALKSKYGTVYKVGSSTNVLYEAAGGSDDWALGVAGVKYSYTMELRDTGDNGFVLPPDQIVPSGEETILAIIDMCNSIALERGLKSKQV